MGMKLTVIALLLMGGIASADDYAGPPGGYGAPGSVQIEDPRPDADVVQADYRQPRDPRMQRPRPDRAQKRAERQVMRRMVLERFDRNGDGRLEPRERRQAARMLRKMARKLAAQDRKRGA